jgi:hypothetical protein
MRIPKRLYLVGTALLFISGAGTVLALQQPEKPKDVSFKQTSSVVEEPQVEANQVVEAQVVETAPVAQTEPVPEPAPEPGLNQCELARDELIAAEGRRHQGMVEMINTNHPNGPASILQREDKLHQNRLLMIQQDYQEKVEQAAC